VDDVVIVDADAVRAAVTAVLVRAGAVPDEAATQTEHLVEAELRGHPSHGIRRLPVLVDRLAAGTAVSGAEPEFAWRTESALAVEASGALGPVVAHRALDLLLDRAASTGIALATIRGGGHLGMLAPYLERIVAAGSAGVVLSTSEALVHPWGGTTAMVGTNPIGIGVPADGDALILDMSTAATPVGRIHDFAARGEPIPLGWAVDADGVPTTDAVAASQGSISPFGGAKGYALGLALQALVGVLAGTAFGPGVRGTLDTHPSTKGDVLIVFSLDALGATGTLGDLAAYLDDVRRSGAAVTTPGERARRERAARAAAGIPLDAAVWARVLALRDAPGDDDAGHDAPDDAPDDTPHDGDPA
jgi:LDH2 family malate/lactate/ureidoglycolate dehydrogenase